MLRRVSRRSPPGVSRGFRNVSDQPSSLMGMAGGRDPGRINWPESVRAAAAAVGVSLPQPSDDD